MHGHLNVKFCNICIARLTLKYLRSAHTVSCAYKYDSYDKHPLFAYKTLTDQPF